jgi:hypothetical protein
MKRTVAALLLAGILAGCGGAAPTPAPAVQSDYITRIVLRMVPSLLGAGTFRVAP